MKCVAIVGLLDEQCEKDTVAGSDMFLNETCWAASNCAKPRVAIHGRNSPSKSSAASSKSSAARKDDNNAVDAGIKVGFANNVTVDEDHLLHWELRLHFWPLLRRHSFF